MEAAKEFAMEFSRALNESAGRFAVPASVRGSPLKRTGVISPKGFHVMSMGFSPAEMEEVKIQLRRRGSLQENLVVH